MEIPDNILLNKIEERGVYFDIYSEEKSTSVVKPKYKLSVNMLPAIGIYFFCVLTTNKDACDSLMRLTVSQMDWEDKDSKHLNRQFSYIDIKKTEVLQKTDLLFKIKDRGNKFVFVARIARARFEELKLLKCNVEKSSRFISERKRNVIDIAFAEANIPDEVLTRLGLA